MLLIGGALIIPKISTTVAFVYEPAHNGSSLEVCSYTG